MRLMTTLTREGSHSLFLNREKTEPLFSVFFKRTFAFLGLGVTGTPATSPKKGVSFYFYFFCKQKKELCLRLHNLTLASAIFHWSYLVYQIKGIYQ